MRGAGPPPGPEEATGTNPPSASAAANSQELEALEAQSPARHGRPLPSRGLAELRRRHQPLPPRRCPPPSHRHKEAGAKRGERRRRRETLTSSRCPLPGLRPHPPSPPPAAALRTAAAPAPNGRRELTRAESQAGAAASHRAAKTPGAGLAGPEGRGGRARQRRPPAPTPSPPRRPRSGGGAGGLLSRRALRLRPPLPRKINKYGRRYGPHPRRPGAGSARPPGSARAALGGRRRRRGARGYVMVPPRRRRRPGSRAAVGVCAGETGLGVASARAPRAPCHCLGPSRRSPARLPSALSRSRSSHSARRPACPLSPAPSRPLSPPA